MFRATAFLLVTLLASPAIAQTPPAPVDQRAFRASIAAVRFDAPANAASPGSAITTPAASKRRVMGKGQRILVTALAGAGGMFAGGYIGAAIDGECGGCDDPGFKGFLIGMPIGAAAAAITTWMLSGK